MNEHCPLCGVRSPLLEHALAVVIGERPPASPGHLPILPRRHVADWFDTRAEQRQTLFELADTARAWLEVEHRPDGYNMGVNVGETAGQTALRAHLHLIPRHPCDLAGPRGGVRGVIPARQSH